MFTFVTHPVLLNFTADLSFIFFSSYVSLTLSALYLPQEQKEFKAFVAFSLLSSQAVFFLSALLVQTAKWKQRHAQVVLSVHFLLSASHQGVPGPGQYHIRSQFEKPLESKGNLQKLSCAFLSQAGVCKYNMDAFLGLSCIRVCLYPW